MPSNDYRLEQISTVDITGGDARATVTLHPKRSIQSDAIDGDEARGISVSIKLNAAEKNALQAIRDRATAKMDARRAARSADAAIDLANPLANEIP